MMANLSIIIKEPTKNICLKCILISELLNNPLGCYSLKNFDFLL